MSELLSMWNHQVLVGIAQAATAVALCLAVVFLCRRFAVHVERETAFSLARGFLQMVAVGMLLAALRLNIPAIFISGLPGEEVELKAFQVGATDFIRKPVKNNVLLARVAKVLRGLPLQPRVDGQLQVLLAGAADERVVTVPEQVRQVIDQDPKYADAYYELGKLLLERGEVKEAISNLEAGTKLTPESDYIHYQLAMAYRRDSRNEDAQRELKLYQTLKNRNRGRDVPESN